jgi:hypothetical protein
MATNIMLFASDIDLTGAYPSGGEIGNVSKGTNVFVLCKIEGLEEYQQREIGINLTSVVANPVSLAMSCYGMPSLDVFYAEFEKEMCNVN